MDLNYNSPNSLTFENFVDEWFFNYHYLLKVSLSKSDFITFNRILTAFAGDLYKMKLKSLERRLQR